MRKTAPAEAGAVKEVRRTPEETACDQKADLKPTHTQPASCRRGIAARVAASWISMPTQGRQSCSVAHPAMGAQEAQHCGAHGNRQPLAAGGAQPGDQADAGGH